jgi:hypothetical protein
MPRSNRLRIKGSASLRLQRSTCFRFLWVLTAVLFSPSASCWAGPMPTQPSYHLAVLQPLPPVLQPPPAVLQPQPAVIQSQPAVLQLQAVVPPPQAPREEQPIFPHQSILCPPVRVPSFPYLSTRSLPPRVSFPQPFLSVSPFFSSLRPACFSVAESSLNLTSEDGEVGFTIKSTVCMGGTPVIVSHVR